MLNLYSLIPDWVLMKMPRNNILVFLIDTTFLGLLLKSIGMITASFQGSLAYGHNPILNHIEQQRTSLLATISTISIVSSSMFKLVSSNNLMDWHEIHLTPLLSGYDGRTTTVSSSERSAKLDLSTCTIHPFIKLIDVVIGVFNVHKAYYLNEQRTIRMQSHNRLQTVFPLGSWIICL